MTVVAVPFSKDASAANNAGNGDVFDFWSDETPPMEWFSAMPDAWLAFQAINGVAFIAITCVALWYGWLRDVVGRDCSRFRPPRANFRGLCLSVVASASLARLVWLVDPYGFVGWYPVALESFLIRLPTALWLSSVLLLFAMWRRVADASSSLHRIQSRVVVGRYALGLWVLSLGLVGAVVLGGLGALGVLDRGLAHDVVRGVFAVYILGYVVGGVWTAMDFSAVLAGWRGDRVDDQRGCRGLCVCDEGGRRSRGTVEMASGGRLERSASPGGTRRTESPLVRPSSTRNRSIRVSQRSLESRLRVRTAVIALLVAAVVGAAVVIWAMVERYLDVVTFLVVEWMGLCAEAIVGGAVLHALASTSSTKRAWCAPDGAAIAHTNTPSQSRAPSPGGGYKDLWEVPVIGQALWQMDLESRLCCRQTMPPCCARYIVGCGCATRRDLGTMIAAAMADSEFATTVRNSQQQQPRNDPETTTPSDQQASSPAIFLPSSVAEYVVRGWTNTLPLPPPSRRRTRASQRGERQFQEAQATPTSSSPKISAPIAPTPTQRTKSTKRKPRGSFTVAGEQQAAPKDIPEGAALASAAQTMRDSAQKVVESFTTSAAKLDRD